jgi:acyl-coenzyme A synthetase/AMP-(fatty) acid ligase
MDSIADVAVVGVADDRAGELPRAFVVRRPNCEITENDVKSFVADKVAPFKRLEGGVKFIKEIPKNASGKTLRKALKHL